MMDTALLTKFLEHPGPTFQIIQTERALGGEAIKCHVCGLTSYNPNDVRHRYCGNCHMDHELVAQLRKLQARVGRPLHLARSD